MKILLVGNYRAFDQQSMLRFSTGLAAELRIAGHDVRLIQPQEFLARGIPTQNKVGKWLGYFDKFVLFLPRLRKMAAWADVVHICDHAYSWYTHVLPKIPTIVTCHDLMPVRCSLGEFPGQTVSWTGRRYQESILRGLEKASLVGCVSAATRADLLRLSKVVKERTAIVHNGYNFPFNPMPADERNESLKRLGLVSKGRFMIHVGADVWYKNLPGLLQIFSRLIQFAEASDMGLIMVGNKPTRELRRLLSVCDLRERVSTLWNVADEDLRALYSGAVALIFPSLCEGFGWPIIEAQACGCPVFTSDRLPMTEVGGAGAVYFNPEHWNEAADVIRRNLKIIPELRYRGLANAKRFSSVKMTKSYVSLYNEATNASKIH